MIKIYGQVSGVLNVVDGFVIKGDIMAEVTVDIGLACAICGDPLEYEEIEVEMIFNIKPCKVCKEKQREAMIVELKKKLDRI